MYIKSRNIYQIARESAGFTQEKAAELLGISVESIRAYEGDRRVPPDHIVATMVEVYNTLHLGYQHLKYNSPLACQFIPTINTRDLPTAVLKLHKEVTDFLKCRDDLIEIASDGVIDKSERVRFNEIMRELEEIVGAIYALRFVNE